MSNLIDSLADDAKNLIPDIPFLKEDPILRFQALGDFKEGFVIGEILNNDKDPSSFLYLKKKNMPHQPFSFGGSLKVVKEYYPANPEAVTQVLNSEESDLNLKGRFYSKQYTEDGYYTPKKYCDALDLLRRRGNLLYLNLAAADETGKDISFTRYGYLKKTDFKMKTLGDIDYEISFDIISIDKPTRYPIFPDFTPDSVNTSKAFDDILNDIKDVAEMPMTGTIPASFLRDINILIADLAAICAVPKRFADNVLNTVNDVYKMSSQALAIMRTTQNDLAKIQRRIGKVDYQDSKNPITNELTYDNLEFYQAQAKVLRLSSTAVEAQKITNEQISIYSGFVNKEIITTVFVRPGISLQNLAVTYYNNSASWTAIYEYNQLTSVDLQPQQMLRIPVL